MAAKKFVWVLLSLVIILSMGFAASCGTSTTTPTATIQAPTTTQPTATTEPIELILSTYDSPTSAFTVALEDWAKEIEAATNGKVTYDLYTAQALGESKEHFDMAVSGRADITKCAFAYTAGKFPLTEIFELPLIFPESAETCSLISQELYENTPAMQEEFAEAKILGFVSTNAKHVITIKKQVKTLEDMEGLKLRVTGAVSSATLELLGAVPVPMPPTDVYTSLERGTLDGCIWEWEGVCAFGVEELAKYAAVVSLYAGPCFYAMNWDVYNGLPSDIKNVIDEHSGMYFSETGGKVFDETNNASLEKVKAQKVEIYYLPDEEKQRWQEAVEPIYDEKITELEKAGLPGQETFDRWVEIAEKYK